MIGRQLLHYKIIRKLGAGGMGEVFEAEDLKLGRTVALKFVLEQIAQDEQAIGRFEREAKAVSRMDHPNVGAVFALEQAGDKTFLAMARYQGQTLRERLDRKIQDHGRLSLPNALRFSLEIARGLEHAHAQGVTHRDVKPANIFVAQTNNTSSNSTSSNSTSSNSTSSNSTSQNSSGSNSTGVIKLLDFGLARLEDASRMMTQPGVTTGTLMYMAPEQMRGQTIGHQVDVWAWGAVTFEMLAGRPPFVQENIAALLAAILSLEPDALEDLCPEAPVALIALVKRALRKNPTERIENASLIVQELEVIISSAPASSMGSSAPASSMGSSAPASSMGSSAPASRGEAPSFDPSFKPNVVENPSSASDHPAFVSASNWSNTNWSESVEPQVETRVETSSNIKPSGSKSALWLLAPVALVGIVAGGFGILNSRLAQPNILPSVQPESSSQAVIATNSSTAVAPNSAKPVGVKSVVIPAKTPAATTVPAEVTTAVAPVAMITEPARATFSTAKKPSNATRSNSPKTEIITPAAAIQTKTIAEPARTTPSKVIAPVKTAPVKTAPVKTVPVKTTPANPINSSATTDAKPTAVTAAVVDAAPKPPLAADCKPVVQTNAVLERVLIASGNTLPLTDCGSYLHAKGPGNPSWFPEALEVRREVIALRNGTVMIADAVHYSDSRKPLGLMPLPADAKPVPNADLGGGHQWRSESENITVNAMNLIFMESRIIRTEANGAQLEVSSTDNPRTDFVFLTVYQGGQETISNLNVTSNDTHKQNFAGVLLNDETAFFLAPGAQANTTNFDVTVPPGIKSYLIAGLEPGKNFTLGFEPDRNWWYISIKPGNDGTVNNQGVVVLETKAPTN